MRFLLLLTVVSIGMLVAGWLTFRQEPGRLSFTIEASKIRHDATNLFSRGKEVIDGATDEWKASRVRDTSRRQPTSADHL